jgi:hypothetical protein
MVRTVDQHVLTLFSMATSMAGLKREVAVNLNAVFEDMVMDGEFGGYDPAGERGNRDLLGREGLLEEIVFANRDEMK